jgi:CheY-like chemotaxis protein
LRVEIEDTGPGLSPRAREQIFEPFAQRREVAVASLDGHGLGLALAHAITERMGGTIGVESEQGRGSTFWFECAFTRAKESLLTTGTTTDDLMVAAHGAQGRRLMGSRLLRRHVDERPRVLVVDSDVTNQRLLKALLSRLGFGCDVVTSGAVALEIIDAERYGLVLVDCATQADDGYETIRRLRARDASSGQRLPVVALIAHAAAVDSAVAAGANDQLSTPTDPGRLATVLARWITD